MKSTLIYFIVICAAITHYEEVEGRLSNHLRKKHKATGNGEIIETKYFENKPKSEGMKCQTQREKNGGKRHWLVDVVYRDMYGYSIRCLGSQIHERVVLTERMTCLQGIDNADFYVRRSGDERGNVILVTDWKENKEEDIALLYLQKKSNFPTVCFSQPFRPFEWSHCFIGGTLNTSDGHSKFCQVTYNKVFPSKKSKSRTNIVEADGEIMYFPGKEVGLCKIGFGSPVMCYAPGARRKYFQAGILVALPDHPEYVCENRNNCFKIAQPQKSLWLKEEIKKLSSTYSPESWSGTLLTEPADVEDDEFPWLGKIISNGEFVCTATRINSQMALTSRECIKRTNDAEIKIIFPSGEEHSLYIPLNREEIVIVYWCQNKEITKEQSIPLEYEKFKGPCMTLGSGLYKSQSSTSKDAIPRKINIDIVDNDLCYEYLNADFPEKIPEDWTNFTCAGGKHHHDTCLTDIGGPIICSTSKTTYAQVGVLFEAIGCGYEELNTPNLYLSLKNFNSSIMEQTNEIKNGVWSKC